MKLRVNLQDQLLACLAFGAGLIFIFIFAKIIFDIAALGGAQISLDYLLSAPQLSGRAGGIGPILLSTILVVAIALIVALPLSLGTAIFVTQYLNPSSRFIPFFRVSMLVLASIPSIAFGLFGYMVFASWFGFGTSLLTGGLTLAIMIIPLCCFAFEDLLRLFPAGYIHGAHALGGNKAQLIFALLLPALKGEVILIMLMGMGRALCETAALLFTSGYSYQMPQSLLDPGRVLSVHIYDLTMNIPGGDAKGAAGALVLLGLFLLIGGATLALTGLILKNHKGK